MFPINYHEPLFRPPSEARSLILQITLGCSWNKCAFCEMYTSKKFTSRPQEKIFEEIDAFIPYRDSIHKIFLADGDPLVLSNKRLVPILKKLNDTFPRLRRISTYASPTNLLKKTPEELKELRENGLSLLYVGIESGNNETLHAIQKGETHASTIQGINKGQMAGMDCSVMIINGVGGQAFSKEHAIESAIVLNETQPKFASTLVLTAHKGMDHFKNRFLGDFTPLSQLELFTELKTLISHTNLESTIFRSDHASNNLVLKGTLGRDKDSFIEQIDFAIEHNAGNRNRTYYGY